MINKNKSVNTNIFLYFVSLIAYVPRLNQVAIDPPPLLGAAFSFLMCVYVFFFFWEPSIVNNNNNTST